jgi:hypothetical protein
MKTKLTRQFSVLIALLAFLAILGGNALAAPTQVDNKEIIVSPYWQSDSGSYTFIAVSHTSLSGMASQIGVIVNAVASNYNELTVANQVESFGNAITFTVQSGTTKRVFIVRSGHPTINPTSITDAAFITGTTNFTHGTVRVDQLSSNPEEHTTATYNPAANIGGLTRSGEGWRDATMLSFWGSVVVEKNTTGFAMEFIGDMNDSQGGLVKATGVISGVAAP